MASADLKEELNCSICLDVYRDPVTLRCGHNFCEACINRVLDTQRRQGVFTCPDCRAVFKRRPWLQKNVTLSNISQRFHCSLPDQKKVGVSCTYCIHSVVPAIQTCLHCEASLCDNHLIVHSKSPEHVLIEPNTSPEMWKCFMHNQILQYFCTVDSTCLCKLCLQGAIHQKHQTQTIDEAFKKKKDKLKNLFTQLTAEKQETEKRLQSLQEKKKAANDTANNITAHVNGLFQQIRQRLDIVELQTVDNITKQAEKNAKPVSDLIQQLEVKKDELYSKMCHIEELGSETDPLKVLQERESNYMNFCLPEMEDHQDDPQIKEIDEILVSLNLHKELSEVLKNVPKVLNLPGMTELRLDKTTAASNVVISPDLLIAHGTQDYDYDSDSDEDDEDDRFESHQVLSKTGLKGGRHYWEVELCDTNNWRIGMSYFSIDREGQDAVFGNTYESWCFCKSLKSYSFKHSGFTKTLPFSFKRFKRLGIYLDFNKGQLSFYNLEPEVRHLHTFYHKFREPLHAAIRVGSEVWVKILN